MITMTYDEYDSMIDAFQKIKDRDKVIPVWPSVAQIDMFKKDPEKWKRDQDFQTHRRNETGNRISARRQKSRRHRRRSVCSG